MINPLKKMQLLLIYRLLDCRLGRLDRHGQLRNPAVEPGRTLGPNRFDNRCGEIDTHIGGLVR
jgi:hypothetical protein